MATKKRSYDENIPEGFSLNDVLQDSSNSVGLHYGSVNGNTIRRLNHCVGELGGMVTYYVDHNNQRLCFSVRIGSEKRGYQCESVEHLEQTIEAFIGKLTPALVRLKKAPPPKPD